MHVLMLALGGFTHAHVPAHYEDVGGPESGPCVEGYEAYDEWYKNHGEMTEGFILVDGVMVDHTFYPTWMDEMHDPRVDGYNVEFLGAKPARNGEDY